MCTHSISQPPPLHQNEGQLERHITGESSSLSSHTQPTIVFGGAQELQELAVTESAKPPPSTSPRIVRKETWKEFWASFWTFMAVDGNWTDLAGTSLSWLTIDFVFYFFSVNSPRTLAKLWNTGPNDSVYGELLETGYRALIAVSSSSVLGGTVFLAMSRYRWHIQLYGFWVLAAVFAIVGVSYVTLIDTRYFAAVIVLYSVCNLFFYLGEQAEAFRVSCIIRRLITMNRRAEHFDFFGMLLRFLSIARIDSECADLRRSLPY
jgi:hypothetical protein